jgi:predicted site-specific integrase-resolvase
MVNLREWALANGVHPVTAYRWFREGKLPVPATRVGGLIPIDQPAAAGPAGVTAVYARVSSADQRQDLDRQVARVTTWATGHNLPVDRVVTEVGSAVNGRRGKLLTLLADRRCHHDRGRAQGPLRKVRRRVRTGRGCRRPGVGCWSWTLLELMTTLPGDVSELLTLLCARRYGRTAAASRVARAVAALGADVP